MVSGIFWTLLFLRCFSLRTPSGNSDGDDTCLDPNVDQIFDHYTCLESHAHHINVGLHWACLIVTSNDV